MIDRPGHLQANVVRIDAVLSLEDAGLTRGYESGEVGRVLCGGLDYVLKRPIPTNPTQAVAEAIGYWFAARARAPVPDHDLVRDPRGEIVFGSLAVRDFKPLGSARIATQVHVEALSRIFAVDLLLSNVDRHMKNYVIGPPDDARLLAIDFGRGIPFDDRHLSAGGVPQRSNTADTAHELDRNGLLDRELAVQVLDELATTPLENFEALLDKLPSEMLGAQLRNGLLDWRRNLFEQTVQRAIAQAL